MGILPGRRVARECRVTTRDVGRLLVGKAGVRGKPDLRERVRGKKEGPLRGHPFKKGSEIEGSQAFLLGIY